MERTSPSVRVTWLIGALLLAGPRLNAAPPAALEAVVQAEDFVRQEGGQGVAKVATAFGGKVQGYEFGRRGGH
ncbi:MAG TPA: hypothetical protein PLD58_13225 [Phycisphaerae bacterium]|nr:hypothetical protein [Phycisphaerae bacterium]